MNNEIILVQDGPDNENKVIDTDSSSDNKDEAKKYNSAYYQKNKNYWQKKITCDVCGSEYSNGNKTKHYLTKKHRMAAGEIIKKCGDVVANKTNKQSSDEMLNILKHLLENQRVEIIVK